MKLVLETKEQENKTPAFQSDTGLVMMTPPVGDDYWLFRVRVSENQAILGFPKFTTIGIGFENEEDWNTNLPYTESAEGILKHIWHNRGTGNNGPAFRKLCLAAIAMIQDAATAHKKEAL